VSGSTITDVDVAVFQFPTDGPEADGTLEWDSTTAVTVTLRADGATGLGWTYSSPAAAAVIRHHLADVACGLDAMDVAAGWEAMRRACRNFGSKGLVMQAISAVDIAWWDLQATLLDRPVTEVLGRCRDSVPIYGSGGFTSLTDAQLADQVEWWRGLGTTAMKIKIGQSWGTRVDRDLLRVCQLRGLAGDGVELMVDANGGYSVGEARRVGAALDELGVVWFEEPVSSEDVDGLRAVRNALRCDVAAGEYAADLADARALLPVVDCLQLDATRCGGWTGFLRGAALAQAHQRQVSAHCGPAVHAAVAAAVPNLRHVEYFADHARLEPLLLDGVPAIHGGALHPDTTRPGHGMTLSERAAPYRLDG